MSLNSSETSLVVAGGWNPAILSPAWVLQYALNRAGSNEPVQIAFPASTSLAVDFPRFTLAEFTWIVRPDLLLLTPPASTPEAMARVEEAAAAMLDNLPHTPLNGLGHNFEFRDAAPDPERLGVFTRASQDISDNMAAAWTSAATQISSSFRNDDGSAIANVQRQFDGTSIIIKFNFHYPLNTVQQALEVLRGERGRARMLENLDIARNLTTTIYGPIQ